MGIKASLEKAGLSVARAAVGGAVAVLTGAGALAEYHGAYALGVGLLIGAGAGILRLIQTWLPGMSFAWLLGKLGLGAYTAIVDSFARAFLSSLVVFGIGASNSPNLTISAAAGSAALAAAYTAGLRAVQGLITKGEQPFASQGAGGAE